MKTEYLFLNSMCLFQVGSSKKISLVDTAEKTNNVAAVWKLDDDDEYIDADDLLNEDDVKKPDPSSLKGISKFLK